MQKINLTILGNPQAQKRHRHVNRGKFISTYDPSKDLKADFLYNAIHNNKPKALILTPIGIILSFYMPRPKAHYGTGKNSQILKKSAPEAHSSKPDIDNMIKFVLDSLNGIYFKDDSQVFIITAKKLYSERPRTEIEIEIIND